MDMSRKERYQNLYQQVQKEHEEVFEKQEIEQIENLMNQIKRANRIFVMGVGREGITARAFAMRIMHLGKEVHWIWDDTTPGMEKDDLFLVVNGSGEIGHIHYVVERAKEIGVYVEVVTGNPTKKTSLLADGILFVQAAVYNGTDERVVPSVQPMGNLFEQHLFLLFDIIIMMLEKEMGVKHSEMERRHRNIE